MSHQIDIQMYRQKDRKKAKFTLGLSVLQRSHMSHEMDRQIDRCIERQLSLPQACPCCREATCPMRQIDRCIERQLSLPQACRRCQGASCLIRQINRCIDRKIERQLSLPQACRRCRGASCPEELQFLPKENSCSYIFFGRQLYQLIKYSVRYMYIVLRVPEKLFFSQKYFGFFDVICV